MKICCMTHETSLYTVSIMFFVPCISSCSLCSEKLWFVKDKGFLLYSGESACCCSWRHLTWEWNDPQLQSFFPTDCVSSPTQSLSESSWENMKWSQLQTALQATLRDRQVQLKILFRPEQTERPPVHWRHLLQHEASGTFYCSQPALDQTWRHPPLNIQ